MSKIDDHIQTKFMNEQHRLITNVVFTASSITNAFSEYSREYGISSPQFNILRILRGAGDWLTMTTVKERMVEKSPNATRLADKLLAKGYVERKRSDQDRRVVFLKITDAGLGLLKTMDANPSQYHEELFGRLTEEEAAAASRILDKLRG